MDLFFLLAIFIIAFFYSSVGHGGATGYLALMAVYGFLPEVMRPSALVLNLLVSMIAFLHYYSKGYFRLKILLPFAITSFPMAFLGSGLQINPLVYKILLGIALLFAATRLLVRFHEEPVAKPVRVFEAAGWGVLIGFLSGIIGIGGGVFLSPLLLIRRWAGIKETAAISAAFIFLNSLSGSLAILPFFANLTVQHYAWIGMAFLGAMGGAWSGSRKFTPVALKYTLSVILLIVSLKLIAFPNG
ncbi:MAG: sulfite exporter TauE/SafE family protein [Bacteroidetes bacterium]|nr:sulfite exporter TauE/SafE family protein [Bacteroidota bacterium]